MDNKKDKEKRDTVLGWFYICLVLGTPAIIIFTIVFGFARSKGGIDFIGNVFWWGLGLVTLLAMFGIDPFRGDKK